MDGIKIGTVECTNVFKALVQPIKNPVNPVDGKPQQMTGSKLTFLTDPADNWAVRGEITVPGALTFGKVYDIILVDHIEKHALDEGGRKFQELTCEPSSQAMSTTSMKTLVLDGATLPKPDLSPQF